MYIVKLIIYFFILFIVGVFPLIIGGFFINNDNKTLKNVGYVLGFLYIPYFILMGLTGMFQKVVDILKLILNL